MQLGLRDVRPEGFRIWGGITRALIARACRMNSQKACCNGFKLGNGWKLSELIDWVVASCPLTPDLAWMSVARV